MAVSFEREIAEKASEEVDRHLDGTTKFLREANCTPLGLAKMWDGAQAESVKLAQHQLETAGSRKRGRGKKGNLHKHIAKHFSFHSRPKGRARQAPDNVAERENSPFPMHIFRFPLKSTSRNIFGNLVPLPTCSMPETHYHAKRSDVADPSKGTGPQGALNPNPNLNPITVKLKST